ncbi:glycosyltransferase [Enterococcus sp. JM9B]|uniref:glycosyltransferase n=1 Tax=Enterococcus sp. JM9B TaxID=1857216 RepID=UPI001374C212|nr:glycosyltransferase [Enterococcus sp. JM9B]KAF1303523.1 hypothetical protein BAU16_04040 [Enterococcus sp. JM9B]
MRIFILMYNFPPIGAGRGIAWANFSEQLSKKHDVTVFTIDPSKTDPIYNSEKLDMISNEYRVVRSYGGRFYEKLYPSKEKRSETNKEKSTAPQNKIKLLAKSIYKKKIKSFFFPDRMIFWNQYLKKSVLEISGKNGNPDVIISVGFPFSTHLLAKKLKKYFNCKLIFDYGDPWSFNPSNETVPKRRRILDRYVEKRTLKHADFVTVTTSATLDEYVRQFPFIKNKIAIISQGVDTKIYERERKCTNNSKHNINFFYSGIFYEDIRNPESFFNALEKINSRQLNNRNIVITIAGKMEQYVLERIQTFDNKNITFNMLGNIGFNEVVDNQINTDALLFFGNLGSVQVPGKLFEYLATDRPIFAICDEKDYSKEVINSYDRGRVSTYDENEIIRNLITFIQDYSDGNFEHIERVKDYDWAIIGEKYLKIIDQMQEEYL